MLQHQVFVCDEGNDLADATAYVAASKAETIWIDQLKMVTDSILSHFIWTIEENTSHFFPLDKMNIFKYASMKLLNFKSIKHLSDWFFDETSC